VYLYFFFFFNSYKLNFSQSYYIIKEGTGSYNQPQLAIAVIQFIIALQMKKKKIKEIRIASSKYHEALAILQVKLASKS
jgi:hypothetical protein